MVHGICGIWGLWAAGIFCLDANVRYAAYPNTKNACKTGQQFGVQVVGSLAILAWTIGISTFMFLCIKFTVGVRISSDAEVEHLYSYFTLTLLIHLCASLALLCVEKVEHLYSFFTLPVLILLNLVCDEQDMGLDISEHGHAAEDMYRGPSPNKNNDDAMNRQDARNLDGYANDLSAAHQEDTDPLGPLGFSSPKPAAILVSPAIISLPASSTQFQLSYPGVTTYDARVGSA